MEILSNYWNFSLRISLVREVDLKNKVVKLENGKKDYDMLVVAAGSTPNFYDVKGTDLALPAYWLSSFELINRKLKDLKTGRPRIVVVGAGYVGLEVAAEIMGLFKSMSREAKITVVEKMDHILPGFGNELARKNGVRGLNFKRLGFQPR
ncbi:MAG: FAD-dependent oxidoreductase [Thermoproteota archaeon]